MNGIGISDARGLSKYYRLKWRLPNCELSDGWIRLHDEKGYSSKNKVARLLREKSSKSIVNDASQKQKDITPELEVQLAEHIGMVVGLMASKQSEAISLVTAGEDGGLLAKQSLEN